MQQLTAKVAELEDSARTAHRQRQEEVKKVGEAAGCARWGSSCCDALSARKVAFVIKVLMTCDQGEHRI